MADQNNDIELKENIKKFITTLIDQKFATYKSNLDNSRSKFDANMQAIINEKTSLFANDFSTKIQSFDKSFKSLSLQLEQSVQDFIKLKTTELTTFKEETKLNNDKQASDYKRDIDNLMKSQTSDFSDFKALWQQNFESIKSQIEGLLPEASAVGLSESFKDTSDRNRRSLEINKFWFLGMLGGMLFVPFVGYFCGMLPYLFGPQSDFEQFCYSALRLAALDFPFLIAATYFSRRMHYHLRMLAEYTYKYTTAMTFVGMSKEAKENPKLFGETHIKELTTGFRNVVYDNPASHMDKATPPITPLETISDLVGKIGVEGVKALADNIKK